MKSAPFESSILDSTSLPCISIWAMEAQISPYRISPLRMIEVIGCLEAKEQVEAKELEIEFSSPKRGLYI